jgi:hypothetical protein
MGVDPEEVIQAISEYGPDKIEPRGLCPPDRGKGTGGDPRGWHFRGDEKPSGPLRPKPGSWES